MWIEQQRRPEKALPFTLAHPAAVLPLLGSGLMPSALVIGSMAPDLEYFLRLSTSRAFGHTLPGLFLLTLPLAFIALLLWHRVLKRPCVDLLPETHRTRLLSRTGHFSFMPGRRLLLILVSLLLGAGTHVTWDLFTHSGTIGVELFPFLDKRVGIGNVLTLPLYRVMQHGSTLLGFIAIAAAYIWWFRSAPVPATAPAPLNVDMRFALLLTMAATALTVGAGYWWSVSPPLQEWGDLRRGAAAFVLATMDAFFLLLLIYALCWNARFWRAGLRR